MLQNAPRDFSDGQGLSIEPLEIDNETAKYDLTWFFWETDDGGLAGRVEYRTSLFERDTLDRFIESLQTLLAAAMDSPGTPISQLPLLGATHRAQLETFETNPETFSGPGSMHEMVGQWAEKTPQRTAIVDGAQTCTYEQLDAMVSAVGRGLVQRGVAPEEPVVVRMPRCLRQIAVMLGVMKAGGLYVPVDPLQPRARLDEILEDTQGAVGHHRRRRRLFRRRGELGRVGSEQRERRVALG